MKLSLTLEEPEDIIKYLNYSNDNGNIFEVVKSLVGKVEVPKTEIIAFMEYVEHYTTIDAVNQETEISNSAQVTSFNKPANSKTVWTKKDIQTLKSLIDNNTNINIIADHLDRSPKAVYNQALERFNLTYSTTTDEWKPRKT
jgi:hypothetical protein